ncbi:MAG: hypothetical protein Ct9H300mP28_21890 [Pseudomonadota bacterium]|nr:MAG: hypothetical protein Ct9H300mP28_21890 [Pseudomonadota bacterium]
MLKHGKKGLEDLLEHKVPALDYLVQQTIKNYPDTIQGRMQGLEELLPTLHQIKDPKRQQITLVTIGERMKIPPEMLSREIKRKTNKNLHSERENDTLFVRQILQQFLKMNSGFYSHCCATASCGPGYVNI